MKKLLALLAVLALALPLLTACGSSLVGIWMLDTEGAQLPEGTENDLRFQFKSDGTYTATAFGHTREGKYTFDQGKKSLTLEVDGGDAVYPCTLDGDRLTVTMNGTALNFTRRK